MMNLDRRGIGLSIGLLTIFVLLSVAAALFMYSPPSVADTGVNRSPASISHSVGAGQSTRTTADAENVTVQVPLEVRLSCLDCDATPRSGYGVAIDITVPSVRQSSVGQLRISLAANGVVHIVGPQAWTLRWDASVRTRRLHTEFTVRGLGDGALTVTAVELDSAGQPRWGPSDELFVLQAPDVLLTGKSSGLELWRTLLNRDLATHKISQSEYEQKLRRLLEQGNLDFNRK
jgi:hypothetical protein